MKHRLWGFPLRATALLATLSEHALVQRSQGDLLRETDQT